MLESKKEKKTRLFSELRLRSLMTARAKLQHEFQKTSSLMTARAKLQQKFRKTNRWSEGRSTSPPASRGHRWHRRTRYPRIGRWSDRKCTRDSRSMGRLESWVWRRC